MSKIVIENLNKNYGKKKVLEDISLKFEQGKIYGLVGRNGAGKTTLMKIICKIINYNYGKCDVGNSTIGALIEEPAAYEHMTAEDNLNIFMNCLDKNEIKTHKDRKEVINEILEIIGLQGNQYKFKQYSIGMKKRLGIGIALVNNPDVLVLDEPTSGLDIQGINEVRGLLHLYMSNKKNLIIISSHDTRDIAELCDQIIIIDKGKIIKVLNTFDRDSIKLEDMYMELVK